MAINIVRVTQGLPGRTFSPKGSFLWRPLPVTTHRPCLGTLVPESSAKPQEVKTTCFSPKVQGPGVTWAHTVNPRLLPGVQRGPGRVAHSDPRHKQSFHPRNRL